MTEPPRPPHVISPDEVAAWLSDSAVQVVTIHRTDFASADDILAHGVDIAKCRADSFWGQGFYSSTRPRLHRGHASVEVAVRLLHPLIVADSVRGAEILDTLLEQTGAEGDREAVLTAGYDGVVVHYGPEDITVVAYWSHQARVVVAGEDGA